MTEVRSDCFLSVRQISKRFGAQQALDAVDLELGSDELLVILGPTGAGKTTLLRTIAGLEEPDQGSIVMAGKDVTRLEPAERDVALVFQNFSLYPSWTVRENLEFPLRAPGRRLTESELRQRIETVSELLKITHLLGRAAAKLSGGEMQRVAIGRAIVRRPRLFLMDEPLTNLDAKLRESLRVELLELRRELAIPMLFVTHDQAEALSMADRIVVLAYGKVLQTGTPRAIYEQPLSPLVALQVGQPAMNLVRVKLMGDAWVAADQTPLCRAADIDASQVREHPSQNAERLLGFRPEHVALFGGSTEAVIKVVEFVGASTTVLLTWAGQEVHAVTSGSSEVKPGDIVKPRIDASRALLF
ncbi:MAG: ABC transporter ATP-binding protein [Polyangiaceae bacterium]|nr:ABC transporter ATP-binding protein [Polyangiaceae bacterium]